jgi:hypothetical protein
MFLGCCFGTTCGENLKSSLFSKTSLKNTSTLVTGWKSASSSKKDSSTVFTPTGKEGRTDIKKEIANEFFLYLFDKQERRVCCPSNAIVCAV